MKISNFDFNADYELILDTLMYKIRQIFARISLELSILIKRGGVRRKLNIQRNSTQIRVNISQGHLHFLDHTHVNLAQCTLLSE